MTKRFAIPAAFLLGGLAVWEAAVLFAGIPQFLLPAPLAVAKALATHIPFLSWHLMVTMSEVVAGYLAAFIIAFFFAALFVRFTVLEQGLYPYFIAFKIIPVIALLPFFVLWFGLGFASKVAVVVAICVSPLLVNILKGLKAAEGERLALFTSLSATPWQIFWKLRVPSSLPYIFAGLKVTVMLAFTGAFVAEFVAGAEGLGYVIATSTRALESALAFAAIVVAIAAGLTFFFFIDLLEKKVVFWQKPQDV